MTRPPGVRRLPRSGHRGRLPAGLPRVGPTIQQPVQTEGRQHAQRMDLRQVTAKHGRIYNFSLGGLQFFLPAVEF